MHWSISVSLLICISFPYPKLSCKSLMPLKQTWSEQLMSDVLLRVFGSVISWPLFHFLLSFFFDLVFSPSDTSDPSVCFCQNLLNMKQAELAQIHSTAENLPPFLYLSLSLLACLYGRIILVCEEISWSGIFGVNSGGLIWSFLWKHIDWLKLSL